MIARTSMLRGYPAPVAAALCTIMWSSSPHAEAKIKCNQVRPVGATISLYANASDPSPILTVPKERLGEYACRQGGEKTNMRFKISLVGELARSLKRNVVWVPTGEFRLQIGMPRRIEHKPERAPATTSAQREPPRRAERTNELVSFPQASKSTSMPARNRSEPAPVKSNAMPAAGTQ